MNVLHPTELTRIALFTPPHPWLDRIYVHVKRKLLQRPETRVATFTAPREWEELAHWRPHAIVAHAAGGRIIDQLKSQFSVPTVNTSATQPGESFPSVVPDNVAVGKLAAEYFLQRGYRQFAYIAHGESVYSQLRLHGFRSTLPPNTALRVYRGSTPNIRDLERGQATAEYTEFLAWLMSLPEKTALFASGDSEGVAAIMTATSAGIAPTDRFSIVSGHCLDRPVVPTLSGVDLNEELWGRKTAQLVVSFLEDRALAEDSILIPPRGLTEKESSSRLSTNDANVERAIDFIRRNADTDISVQDVVEEVPLGRRSIEMRFKEIRGHSILHEIQDAHLDLAKRLLADPTLSVGEVSRKLGFSDTNRLIRLFKTRLDQTPAQFRGRFE